MAMLAGFGHDNQCQRSLNNSDDYQLENPQKIAMNHQKNMALKSLKTNNYRSKLAAGEATDIAFISFSARKFLTDCDERRTAPFGQPLLSQ